MRFTTGQLRRLLTNQAGFVAAARSVVAASSQFGNPQRSWMEAAIRAYFVSNRDEEALWTEYDVRVGPVKGRSAVRESLAEGGVKLLTSFIQFHKSEAEIPVECFPKVRDVPVGRHSIAVKRDLIYVDAGGFRARQLWTDHQLRPDHPQAHVMAAAVMVSVDEDLGPGSTREVQVWGLRHRVRVTWSRADLGAATKALAARLDEVDDAIKAP